MAEWETPLDAFFDEAVYRTADQAFRAFGLEAKATVEIITPVDTGLLRMGWNISIDIPSDATPITVDGTFDKGEGSLQDATIASAIIIQNNVEYGPYVNYGTSKMAGRFFVENAIASLQG